MQSTAFPSLQSRFKTVTSSASDHTRTGGGFFHFQAIAEVVRSLFFSSILWMVLAIALYGVYSMVAGSR
jgi:hypothetical protein